jgi:hypothetical protein
MKNGFYVAVGLLLAAPGWAADGTYSGSGTYVSGSGANCQGSDWKLTIEGDAVKAKVFPPQTSPAGIRDVSGTLESGGVIRMSYVAGYGSASGKVDIELKLDGGTIAGFSQSRTCRYRITLQRD